MRPELHPAAALPPPHPDAAGWHGALRLAFDIRDGRTFLCEREHRGPLRVQRPLYPEGPGICHAVIIHPPGGIAGGDTLDIDITLRAGAHAVLTTPGASKWYKSLGRPASQRVMLNVAANARLDWLPQNSILFDDANVALDLTLDIEPGGSAIGWDAVQLGRQASGARWLGGRLNATTTLKRANTAATAYAPDAPYATAPLWIERTILDAQDPLRSGLHGLDGWGAFGTLWAVPAAPPADAGRFRDDVLHPRLLPLLPYGDHLRAGVTCFADGLILIRAVARHMEPLQALLVQCWEALRPVVHDTAAVPLRLWST